MTLGEMALGEMTISRKEQSHAQCHVTHRIRIFDKISEHVKVAKSVDIAVPELAVTLCTWQKLSYKNTCVQCNMMYDFLIELYLTSLENLVVFQIAVRMYEVIEL